MNKPASNRVSTDSITRGTYDTPYRARPQKVMLTPDLNPIHPWVQFAHAPVEGGLQYGAYHPNGVEVRGFASPDLLQDTINRINHPETAQ